MKNLDILLQKYAKLIVEVGANVQKDQRVVVSCSTDNNKFARLVTKEAYNVGAKKWSLVVWWWSFALDVLNQSVETYSEVPNHLVERYRYFVSENVCFIHITSEVPGIFKDADSEKLMASELLDMKSFSFIMIT